MPLGDWMWYVMWFGFAAGEPWRPDRYDPDMSDIVKGIDVANEYLEWEAATFGKLVETTTRNPGKVPDGKKEEGITRIVEGKFPTYTAILFGYAVENRELYFHSDDLPLLGRCGGVVITPDTVLTLCACVISWFLWVRGQKAQGTLKTAPYTLHDYDIAVPDIYVWYGNPTFRPWKHDWRIKLINDPKRQILNNDWCWEAYYSGAVVDRSVPIHQRATPFVARFEVPWAYQYQVLIPWPPFQFHYAKASWNGLEWTPPKEYHQYREAYQQSYLFNMVNRRVDLYDDNGIYIDVGLSLLQVNKTFTHRADCVFLDACLPQGKCTLADPFKIREAITCFRGSYNPIICGAVSGSPIFGSDFGLHGLAMTEYPCFSTKTQKAPHTLVEVMALTRVVSEYIETLIPELIDSSKEELEGSSLFRKDNDYKTYSMVKYLFEVVDDNVPHGKATMVNAHRALTLIFGLICGISWVY